jgi:hypothetical protein
MRRPSPREAGTPVFALAAGLHRPEKLLELPVVHEVRTDIALRTLKTGVKLPLDHLALS